jgi:predicted SAM-dependent methyltransferase
MELFFRRLLPGGQAFIAMPDPFFIDWAKAYDWGHWWVNEHKTLWDRDTFIDECLKIGYELVYTKRNGAGEFVCNNDFHVIVRKPR